MQTRFPARQDGIRLPDERPGPPAPLVERQFYRTGLAYVAGVLLVAVAAWFGVYAALAVALLVTLGVAYQTVQAQRALAAFRASESQFRTQAEIALREREAQYRTLVETSPDAILLMDLGGTVLLCNQPAAVLRGCARAADVLGQNLFDFLVPEDSDRTRGQVAALLKQPAVAGGEYAFQRQDGSRFLGELSLAPVLDDAGRPRALVGIARDITESKRAEAALLRVLAEDRAAKVEVVTQHRAEVMSAISHSLRTPFTALRAGLGMVEASVNDRLRPEERRLLANVRRNAGRVGILIADLLTLNQWEIGVLKLTLEPLDLRAVVDEAVAAVGPLLEERAQSLELDLPEPLPCQGDPRRLEQVIVNLLDNAQRHTPAGTRITVTGHLTADDVCLQVRDDGPGIPVAARERIFARFARLNPAAGGMGLGLAMAKTIVELHGGRIWVGGAEDEGAVFNIVLPALAEEDEPPPPPLPENPDGAAA